MLTRSTTSGWLAVGCLMTAATGANAQLEWRVSVKVLLDENSNRPATGSLNTDAEIIEAFEINANAILAAAGRGYRFRVMEIVELDNLPAPPSNADFCVGGSDHNSWCGDGSSCSGGTCTQLNHWFYAPVNGSSRSILQDEAEAAPVSWAYRSTAMNVYIFGTTSSANGWCARPDGDTNQVFILGQSTNAITPFHEAGHVLGLCHTHGCVPGGSTCDGSDPPTDEMADTLPDKSCWSIDDLSNYAFGDDYANLPGAQQQQVDDAWGNVMSYHDFGNRYFLSSDQLDRMTDVCNTTYVDITNGLTHFVDGFNGGSQDGSSTAPWQTALSGLFSALASPTTDVVLFRPGNYNETPVITFPVSLRATRGNAVIGTN